AMPPLLFLLLPLCVAVGSAPDPGCVRSLREVLERLRELEGTVLELQGRCGESPGPQAGTGLTVSRELCPPSPPSPSPPCPRGCSDQGRCRSGRCLCYPGYSGEDCGTPGCGGGDCEEAPPSVRPRLLSRTSSSLRVSWPAPVQPVDGYRVSLVPLASPGAPVLHHDLPGSALSFEASGLDPGSTFELQVQARREQNFGAAATLRVRTQHAQTLPRRGGSPVPPIASPPPPRSPLPAASPGSPYTPLASLDAPLASPGSPSASPDASMASPGSPSASPDASLASPDASMASPGSPSASPDASMASPGSPSASPRLPLAPVPRGPPAPPLSPMAPPAPWSPGLPGAPSLHDLEAKLAPYNGSLLQRLESHLRATNFPLRGNQTVPAVARAILTYLLRRSPAALRNRLLQHPKPHLMPGAAGEALVDLEGLRGHVEAVVIRYRLLEDPEGTEGEMRVPGDAALARVPGLVPGGRYRMEVHGLVRGHVSKSYTFLVTAGVGGTEEPALGWEQMFEMEPKETHGDTGKEAEPVPPSEEPPTKPRLGELRVFNVTPSSVQLNWSVPEGTFDSFTVQYRDAQGQPQALAVDGGSRTVTVSGLSPSRRYKFNLYGVWGRKRVGVISTDTVTGEDRPREKAPTKPRLGELRVSEVSPDSVQLQWSVPEGTFDSFTLQYRDAQGQPQVLPVDGGSRTLTVPGLSPSRRYKFNLYGLWGRTRLGPVSTDTVTAPQEEEPAAQPVLGELRVSEVSPDSVQLQWSVPEGTFDSFTLQYRDAQGQPQVLPVDGGSRTLTVPGLSPSRRYKFNLYGLWGRTRLGPVSTDTVTAPAPQEQEPAAQPVLGELRVSEVSPDSVQLQWSVPEGTFDSFTLQYRDAQGQPQVLPVDGGSRTLTVPGLSPSRRYKFNLYGLWGRTRLGPVSTDTVTAPAPQEEEPAAQPVLGELRVSEVSPDSVQLQWSVPEGTFDSFTLQYRDAQGQPQVLPVDGGSRTLTVPGLSPSRRYKFNLYGLWGRTRLGPVSTDTVTAPQEEEPAAQPVLGELRVSEVSPDSVQLQWSVPEGTFDSFTLQYRDAQGQPQVLPVDGGSRTLTVPGLSPSRRYKFNLYGLWGRTRLGPVSTDTVTAPAPQEEEPAAQPVLGELRVSEVSPDSVQLQWSVPEGTFDSFTLQYRDAQGQPQVLPVDGGSRTLTVPGLSPSRRYKFNLYGLWGRTRLGPVSTDTVTAPAPQEQEPAAQPVLGELRVSEVSPDSVQLQWSVPEGTFDSFTLQYRDAQGQPQVLPVDGGSRTLTVPGLSPSRRYKFNLYGLWGRTRLGPVSTDTVTAPQEEEPAAQPVLGELRVSEVSPDSVQLQWSVPEGTFDSFTLQYRDAQGQPQVLPVDGGSRTLTVPGLSPSRRYKFNLYGLWGRTRLGPVSTDTVTAPAPREEEPAAQPVLGELRVSEVSPDSVQLQWSVPEGTFDSFTLQYRDAQGQPQVLPVDGGSRTLTVPGLSPSRRYKFNLYGMWGRTRLGPVSTDTVTAAAPQEEEPAAQPVLGELRVSEVSPDSVQLQWSVPEGTFDSFTLQYRDAQGQPQVLPVDGGSRTLTVPGLSPSRRYKFNLYGLWGRTRLGPVSTDTVTAPAPQEEEPAAQPVLGELRVSEVSPDSVQLQWSVPEGTFDSFTLQYRDAQGQPQVLPMDGGSRTLTVPGLSPSRRYKFNLYGLWGRTRLGPVSTDTVTAPQEQEPAAQPVLGELRVSEVSPDSVQLQWSVPEGTFDSFTLQYRDAQGQPQVLPVDGGSRTLTVPGLSPSRRYKFNLYGLWGRTRLGPVSTDTVTAPAPQEEEPAAQPVLGELRVSEVSPDSVQLQWSVPEGTFDSFTLQYRDAQGQPQVLPMDGGSRTLTVPGLSPSRRYKFNLYGLWGRTRLGPVSTDTVTAPAPQEEEPAAQPVLGELRVSEVSPDSVQLQWSVPEGTFDSFTLQYRDAQGQPQVLPVDGGSRTLTVPGLSPSRRYKFNLYGLWGRTRLGPVSTDTVTAPQEEEPAAQPVLGELRVSEVSPDSVQLQWSVPEGTFDSFTLQYRDAQGQPQVLPVDGGSRTLTVPGLSPSRRYKFNLYGLWGRTRLGPVSTDTVTAPQEEEPAAQPVLGELRVSEVSPDSVQLQWSVPEGTFDSFTLQYRDAQGQPQVLPVDGGSRTLTVPGLSPSRRYKFNLYGLWGRTRLGPVSTDTVTAPAPQEEEPAAQPVLGELRVSEVSPDSVQLQWSVPEGTFDSFTLQYRDAQGQPQVLPVDGGSRTLTVPGLSPSRRYKFNLYGLWGRTRLGPVSTDTVTAPAPQEEEPAAQPVLGELRVSEVSPDSVQLQWSVPEGTFDSFTLQYRDAQGQPQVLPMDGGSRTLTVPGLSPSRRYKFNLYGLWGRTRLGPVSTDTVTAPAPQEEEPAAQPVLGELRVSEVSPDSVQLQWSVPEGTFDSFTLQYRDAQGQPQVLPVDGGSRTLTVPGLSPSRRYKFNLYGLWGRTRLGPVSTDTVTAPAPQEKPPTKPRLGELKAPHVSPDSVQLQWSVPEGTFDSFTLQYRDAQGQPQVLPVDGGSRTLTVPGLSPSRRYKFNLYGLWGRTRLGPVSTDTVTGAPGTLWVGSVWPRSARLHWTPPHSPPGGYDLVYGPPGGPQKTLQLPPEATSHELWGLEPKGSYGVQLRGRGEDAHPILLETTFDTPPLPHPHPRDCAEEQLNGPGPSRPTLIFLGGDPARPLRVFCDMDTDGGGWLVFQRRQDGGTDFWRGWDEYERGFGNVSGEFWLGNAALHALTSSSRTELRVDLRSGPDAAFAHYRDFHVDGPGQHYGLRLGAYSGTAGDALSYHAGSPFSTRDRDPRGRPRPCAVAYMGAWWYHNCHYANLNGRYGTPLHHQGITWFPWKGFEFSIPFTEMKLRPQRD
ncbi:LOW QUALITY PROTEIN: tenascin-X-like, partial [Melopsittacus undulatus]|uniref:LOW QUALITY PROTEIN: tenascin-X-like n=1 Tax=Melopsittacus undulatus TaxID=13146 RepID=UPI00146E1CF0